MDPITLISMILGAIGLAAEAAPTILKFGRAVIRTMKRVKDGAGALLAGQEISDEEQEAFAHDLEKLGEVAIDGVKFAGELPLKSEGLERLGNTAAGAFLAAGLPDKIAAEMADPQFQAGLQRLGLASLLTEAAAYQRDMRGVNTGIARHLAQLALMEARDPERDMKIVVNVNERTREINIGILNLQMETPRDVNDLEEKLEAEAQVRFGRLIGTRPKELVEAMVEGFVASRLRGA